MANGKLIVIEGLDSSGKETQSKLLFSTLAEKSYNVRRVEFPDYSSPSSTLVKMYLSGEFGKDANSVNPYAASSFYAVDRFASYKSKWEEFYLFGGIVIADRYTTSNMIHQASKISDELLREKYLNWLIDYEYNLMQLPKPDMVIFLNMPVEVSIQLMANRNNKINNSTDKDIHEKSQPHLYSSYNCAISMQQKYGWELVDCTSNGNVRTIDEIHNDVMKKVFEII